MGVLSSAQFSPPRNVETGQGVLSKVLKRCFRAGGCGRVVILLGIWLQTTHARLERGLLRKEGCCCFQKSLEILQIRVSLYRYSNPPRYVLSGTLRVANAFMSSRHNCKGINLRQVPLVSIFFVKLMDIAHLFLVLNSIISKASNSSTDITIQTTSPAKLPAKLP